jgi:small subunit ribosomal protein S15
MMAEERTKDLVKEFATHEGDTGSPEVQIALLTARIGHLTEHLKTNAKDHSSRRGLLRMVGRRNNLLKYLQKTDFNRYQQIIKRLGLRK